MNQTSCTKIKIGILTLLVFTITQDYVLSQNIVRSQHKGMTTNTSPLFLQGSSYGANRAETAPDIEFGYIEIDKKRYGDDYGHWGNIVRGPGGKFYFGTGNHPAQGGALLIAYDPSDKTHEILLFSRDVLGHEEGKWHGRMDIHPETGDMYLIGFYAGDIVRYNIHSREYEVLGKPNKGMGYPEHRWDWERGLLYGIGDEHGDNWYGEDGIMGTFLIYDTDKHEVIHKGFPKYENGKSFIWSRRARMLDPVTGKLYGTDDTTFELVYYDPESNSFAPTGHFLESDLRAWTDYRTSDNAFWMFDRSGRVYKYYPDDNLLEKRGRTWSGRSGYVAFMAISPGERYLYYSISLGGRLDDLPILQYDTQTDKVKILAFLRPYFKFEYQYEPSYIFGGILSEDGSEFFVVVNGRIVDGDRALTMFNIHIPESERSEDNVVSVGN